MKPTTHVQAPDSTDVRCVGLRATSAQRAQWALAKLVAEQNPGLSAPRVYRSLRRREQLGGTAMGGGVAIPHARIEGFSGTEIVVGVLDETVPYETPDGEPLRMMALVVSDPARPEEHLAALSRVARALAGMKPRFPM